MIGPLRSPSPHPADYLQGELPLAWPLDRSGEAASSALAKYPPLPIRRGVPRPEPYVASLARLLADVIVGARPASHLARHAILDVCQELTRRSALRRARGSGTAASTPVAPVHVTSTNTMVVAPNVAQAVMVFRAGPAAHGVAMRLEYRHGRWMLTDVQTPA
jgi:hypothetical protein